MNGDGDFMIKKLTALLTALILILNTVPALATGEYYEERELPKITAEDLVYKPVDITELKGYIEQINGLITKKGNDKKIMSLIDECFGIYRTGLNAQVLATLAKDRDFTEENIQNINDVSKTTVEIAELISEMIHSLYDSDYKQLLAEMFGTPENALDFALPEDDGEITELLNKEAELTNQYSDIYGDSDACAELFVELMGVRNKMAKIYGYDNYAEYANEVIYGREHTQEQMEEFYSGVKEFILPLYMSVGDAFMETQTYFVVPMSEDDLLLNTRRVVGDVNPELAQAFEYLIANNVYDIRLSDKKNPSSGAYTITLPEKEVPFIFINPYEDYEFNGTYTVKTLIHEFGHFAALLNSPVIENRYGSLLNATCVDTAEVHSQGLEVLAERHYGKIFSVNSAEMRYYMLTELTGAIIDGCILNKWQERIYALENPTVDDLNSVFIEVVSDFLESESTHEEVQELWTAVPHNYNSPMYYLSYALSAMTALGIYSESIDNYDKAVDTYMRVSSEGAYKTFAQITEECNLYDIYDADFIKDTSDTVSDAFALGYSDIPEDAWYLTALYTVSNIMPGRSEDNFAPAEAVTRAEFVGTIGRMYDYYCGIDRTYEIGFSDVDNDSNAEYIAWAETNGIVDGYDDETFGANDPLTREQAAMILYRLSGETTDITELSGFTDADLIADWAREAVIWGYESSVIDGRDNDEFAPKDNITRAETAQIVTNYIFSQY